MTEYVYIYAEGPVTISVCASKEMSRSEIERQVNDLRPTGIQSRWTISKDKRFDTGESIPCECDEDSSCQHWLLNC